MLKMTCPSCHDWLHVDIWDNQKKSAALDLIERNCSLVGKTETGLLMREAGDLRMPWLGFWTGLNGITGLAEKLSLNSETHIIPPGH